LTGDRFIEKEGNMALWEDVLGDLAGLWVRLDSLRNDLCGGEVPEDYGDLDSHTRHILIGLDEQISRINTLIEKIRRESGLANGGGRRR